MKNVRKDERREVIAGRQPVLEALRADAPIEKVYLLHGSRGSVVEKILRLARQRGVPCVEASRQRLEELAGDSTTQGVVAVVGLKRYVEMEELLERARQRREDPFLLVLDEIEDPHNLGALIRTAECAGVHGVIIAKHHATSLTPTVAKASAGATAYMPVARVTNIAQTLTALKSQGLWVIGTDTCAEKEYFAADYAGPLAIVVGNEGSGMRRLVKEACDVLVRIPLYGSIGSLNASVAGALVLFEAARNRKSPKLS